MRTRPPRTRRVVTDAAGRDRLIAGAELLLQAEMPSLLLVNDLCALVVSDVRVAAMSAGSEPCVENDLCDVLFGVFADAVEPASAGP
jgi:hypothetical protein